MDIIEETKTALLMAKAIQSGDTRLEEAIKVWERFSIEKQKEVVREIVETRGNELRSAYPDIVGIAYGIRTYTDKNNKQKINSREPCITFMVERKWKKGFDATNRFAIKQLPEYLYTYCEAGQPYKRELCAVPTDIECGEEYQITPYSGNNGRSLIKAWNKDLGRRLDGVITCEVKLPYPFNDGRYILGCHHVFAMSVLTEPGSIPPINTEILYDDTTVGKLTSLRGRLVPESQGSSFDVALAIVPENNVAKSKLKEALQGLKLKNGLVSLKKMVNRCIIVTPNGDYEAEHVKTWPSYNWIKYFKNHPNPVQSDVVEWHITSTNGVTKPGDSGSPITDPYKNKLLGMLIGGKSNKAFMLSANKLLSGPNYNLAGPLKIV